MMVTAKRALIVVLTLLFAVPMVFGTAPAEEEAVDTSGVPVGRFNEAPMLAQMVAAGELPPVDERLRWNEYHSTLRKPYPTSTGGAGVRTPASMQIAPYRVGRRILAVKNHFSQHFGR